MRYELTDEELLAIHQDHLDHANREILRMEAEVATLPDEAAAGAKARLALVKEHKAKTKGKADTIIKRMKQAGKKIPADPQSGV